MTDQRFELCLPYILKEEGGNSDDPQDHGGRTSRGIIQREYDKWKASRGEVTQDVFKATNQEIHDIYYEEYWLPVCSQLAPGVDLVYFNIAVNAGVREAAILLQRTLDIAENSIEFKAGHEYVGYVTLKYAKLASPNELVNSFSDNILKFYRGLAQFPHYGDNWTSRTGRIRAVALKMTTVLQPSVTVPITQKEPAMPDAPVVMPQMTDPIPEIIAFLEGIKKFVPFISGLPFLPPGVGAGANAAIPIIEEVLALIEAFKSKSGVDLFQTIGQHIQTIGAQVQTATTVVAQAPAKSEGMPNS